MLTAYILSVFYGFTIIFTSFGCKRKAASFDSDAPWISFHSFLAIFSYRVVTPRDKWHSET